MTSLHKLAVAALVLAPGLGLESVKADVWCSLTGVVVRAYDHGGVYLDGTLSGTPVALINICGTAGDCASKATERRLAVALAAQVSSQNLSMYFTGVSACSQVQAYMNPAVIIMEN
jgi:hypothetical protein